MNTDSSNKKSVVIISGLLIALALFSLFFLLIPTSKNKTYIADIYQNGILIYSIPLSEITTPETLLIEGEGGCRNEIQLSPEGISILSADCPDKLCVKQGVITDSKLPITCLPNRLVIQLREMTDGKISVTDDIISY